MKLIKLLTLAGLASVALNAHANKPWLLPSATMVESKEPWVTIDAAISEDLFDINRQPLKLDTITVTGPDGARVDMKNPATGRFRSSFDLQMSKPGTYKVSMVTQNVAGSYKLAGENKRFRGTEDSLAKDVPAGAEDVRLTRTFSRVETFVSANTTSQEVFKPSGVGLELVPVTHPNDLFSGDKATWRFLLDGKPAPNQGFSLIPGGVRHRGTLGEIRYTTDDKGEITFTLPASGMYLVTSSWPAANAAAAGQPPQMPARRATYAATVEVQLQ
jgi:uncharacterized GH25 family protein